MLRATKLMYRYMAGGGRRELYANFAGEATKSDPAVVDAMRTARTYWVNHTCKIPAGIWHDGRPVNDLQASYRQVRYGGRHGSHMVVVTQLS